jgi:hypothetical protein
MKLNYQTIQLLKMKFKNKIKKVTKKKTQVKSS